MKNEPHTLRTILIDDETDARINLRLFLGVHAEVQVVAEANNVSGGISAIRAHAPDLVFLDIQMGGHTGFDLLEAFPVPNFQVIFCTGFNQFALQAIKKNALDYIMKPIDPDDLAAAVQKATRAKLVKNPPRLAFQTAGEVCFVEMDHVYHIESDGMYTTIRLADGRKFVQVRSIREFEELLPGSSFMRTHQSHLVNLAFVEKFLPDNMVLQLNNGLEVPVARRRKAEIQSALGIR
jgi:two-component system LytT family response regulator